MRIVYTVFSNLKYDQRVKQELKTLSKRYDIYSISIGKNGKGKNLEVSTVNFPALRFLIVWVKLFFEINRIKPALIFFADINTAPPALLCKVLYNIPIVFDMHEIGSEMKEKQNYFVKLFWKTIEFITLKNADSVITVSNSLAGYIKAKVNRGVSVLYNYPSKAIWNVISMGDKRNICYVGNLSEDRGLEQIVRAFKELNGYNLTIIGGGKLEKQLKFIASDAANITFRGVVAAEKLPAEIAKYGAGIVMNEGKSVNNRLGLPNKIFQYIATGIPFVCSNLPEMKKIANGTGAGIACSTDLENIKKAIGTVAENYDIFQKKAMKYREIFIWEKQEKILLDLVKRYE